MAEIRRILLSRTDSIGDVVLTLPMAGMIKAHFPNATVLFLGSSYTQAVIASCRHVGEFVDWSVISKQPADKQLEAVIALQVDAIVHVFPRKEIAFLAHKARIPVRIGVMRRWYQVLTCNRLLNFSRKKSDLHEAQLNLKLLAPFGIHEVPERQKMNEWYGLSDVQSLSPELTALFDPAKYNLILHPTSKGSAVEWPLSQYAALIDLLDPSRYRIFITGTDADAEYIGTQLPFDRPNVENMCGRLSLNELVSFIKNAEGFIAASTGPLHLAAALGLHAIGLFSSRRPIHPGRWAPLGPRARYLVDDENCRNCRNGQRCDCIRRIPPERISSILDSMSAQQTSEVQAAFWPDVRV